MTLLGRCGKVTHDPRVAGKTERTVYLQDGRVVDEVRRTVSN